MKTFYFLIFLLASTTACAQDCGGMVNAGGTCVPPNVAQPGSQQAQTKFPRQGLWVNMWGALVIDETKGILGTSVQNQTEAKAWQTAEEDCHTKGGTNCKHWGSYQNQCVAIANGQNGSDAGFGKTQEKAIKKAIKNCSTKSSDCKTYYSACSLPIVIP